MTNGAALELEPEQRQILVEAQEYTELVNSPGWKKLWKFGESRAREALTAIKNSVSSDPLVRLRLQTVWSELELFLDAFHTEIISKIEQRKDVLAEAAIALGATQQQVEELVEQEEFYGR